MTQYGIPDIRDSDGNLKGVDHTIEWNGEEVTINHIPITASEQQAIEAEGEEIEVERMAEYLDEKLVKPEANGEWSLAEIMCYFEAMIDFASGGGGGELLQQAQEALERRAAEQEQGN